MEIRNVTRQDLDAALAAVNQLFDGNVTYNRCDYMGNTRNGGEKWRVTLRVNDSH